jgi:hypothetical protein
LREGADYTARAAVLRLIWRLNEVIDLSITVVVDPITTLRLRRSQCGQAHSRGPISRTTDHPLSSTSTNALTTSLSEPYKDLVGETITIIIETIT